VSTESFWVVNVNAAYDLRGGIALFAGIDNLNDYVQSTLGDEQFSHTWGPLRGRYVYAGVGYRFGERR
jgi:outer membrane receptor protein involved in Fe transport